MEPTYGTYDIDTVDGISELKASLREIENAPDMETRVSLLSDLLFSGHKGSSGYLTFGNTKVAKNTGIFNMNAATDCPNADSSEDNQTDTGVCQVPWDDCYAHKSEKTYPNALPKRRRQEYLWDNMDPVTFAKALRDIKDRKTSPFDHLRVSEAGDFRNRRDILKVNEIARQLEGEINVYTYSASHKLDWSEAEHFTVNQSNGLADYGDRRFTAIPKGADLPDDMVWCAYDVSDGEKKCGDCMLCINEEGPDVAIELH